MVTSERRDLAAAPPAPSRRGGSAHLRLLLAQGEPAEILARIVPHDPLGLRPLVGRRLVDRCLFLDADRVFLAAAARVALDAPRWRGRPGLEAWLRRQVDAAIDGLAASSTRVTAGGIWRDLARPFGFDPLRLATACARLSRRPRAERQAFFLLLVELRPLAEAGRAMGVGAVDLARLARRALDALLAPLAPSPPAPKVRA